MTHTSADPDLVSEPERVATGLLVQHGQALLVLRAPGRRFGGLWALPGGHVEPGERRRDAVERELEEELGVRVEVRGDAPLAVAMMGPIERSIWAIASWDGNVANRAPQEHTELRWFDSAELLNVALAHPEDAPVIVRALG